MISKLNVPGKIKHFLWRACTSSSPTKTSLLKRKFVLDMLCHRCGKCDEDMKHGYGIVKRQNRFDTLVFRFEAAHGNFLDLYGRMVSKSAKSDLFAIIVWHIWVYRNKTRLKEQVVPLDKIRDTAQTYLHLFKASRDSQCRNKPRTTVKKCRWKPPKLGKYILNFDGTIFNENEWVGIGIVVRDSSS